MDFFKNADDISYYSLYVVFMSNVKLWQMFLLLLNILFFSCCIFYFFCTKIDVFLQNEKHVCEWLLVGLLILFGVSYLDPGYFLGADSLAHFAHGTQKYLAYKESIYLNWNNFWSEGQRIPSYYSFTTFSIILLLNIILKSTLLSFKLYMLGCHFIAGVFMYKFLCNMTSFKISALCGALVYSSCMGITNIFLNYGIITHSLIFAFLPLLFDQIYLYTQQKVSFFMTKRLVGIWLISGILIMTYAPLAIVFGLIIIGYVSYLLWPYSTKNQNKIFYLVLSIIPVTIINYHIFYVFLFDSSQVTSNFSDDFFYIRDVFIVRLMNLITWPHLFVGQVATFSYIGITVFFVSFFSFFQMKNTKYIFPVLYFLSIFLLSIFVTFPSIRNIFICVFSLSIIFVIGCDYLFSKLRGIVLISHFIIFFVISDLFLSSTLLLGRLDKNHHILIGEYLSENSNGYKSIFVSDWPDETKVNRSAGGLELTSAFPNFIGNYDASVGNVYNFVQFVSLYTVEKLNKDKDVELDLKNLLCFNGVIKIIYENQKIQEGFSQTKFVGLKNNPVLGNYYDLGCGLPFVTSRYLKVNTSAFQPEETRYWAHILIQNPNIYEKYRNFYESMLVDIGYQSQSSQSQYLLVSEESSQYASQVDGDLNSQPINIQLNKYKVDYKNIDVEFEVDSDGYLQLPYDFNQHQVVYLNGQKVQAVQGVTNFMIIPFKKGFNTIAVVANVDNEMYRDIGTVTIYLFCFGLFCWVWYRESHFKQKS